MSVTAIADIPVPTLRERIEARNVIESVALIEAEEAMRTGGFEAASAVLAKYAPAYDALVDSSLIGEEEPPLDEEDYGDDIVAEDQPEVWPHDKASRWPNDKGAPDDITIPGPVPALVQITPEAIERLKESMAEAIEGQDPPPPTEGTKTVTGAPGVPPEAAARAIAARAKVPQDRKPKQGPTPHKGG